MTRLLDQIKKPADLRHLERPELEQVAAEIRQHIITTVLGRVGTWHPTWASSS